MQGKDKDNFNIDNENGSKSNAVGQNSNEDQCNKSSSNVKEIDFPLDSASPSAEKYNKSMSEKTCDYQNEEIGHFVSRSYSPIISNSNMDNLASPSCSSDLYSDMVRNYPPPIHYESSYGHSRPLSPYMDLPCGSEPPIFYHSNFPKKRISDHGFGRH